MADSFEQTTVGILQNLKRGEREPRAAGVILIEEGGKTLGTLRVITSQDVKNDALVAALAAWREKHSWWFPAQFKVTVAGTREWLQKGVIEHKDRLLFLLQDESGKPIGHMGFYRFDFARKKCEADNIVRGEESHPGIMTLALRRLLAWGMQSLKLQGFSLQTYDDNEKAIALYERCGFARGNRIGLISKEDGERVEWVPSSQGQQPQRFNLLMEWSAKGFSESGSPKGEGKERKAKP
jgi:RimJ/RimL family protein N-acetyltransferase